MKRRVTSGLASPSLSTLKSYWASSAHGKKLGPPLGSWNPDQLPTSVTVSLLSGLTNAYRSVLSTAGSPAISGASRCEDAVALVPPNIAALSSVAATSAAAATWPRRPLRTCGDDIV